MGSLPRRLTALAVALAAAFLVGPAGADAAKVPCIAGKKRPLCYVKTGKVKYVADGDTLDVNVFGDGTSKPMRVRMTGINAMEQSRYSHDPSERRGDCHALEATARLEDLVKGHRVRLLSQARDPMSGHRHRRLVSVRRGGHWKDVGQLLLEEGHVLWLPNGGEWARNSRYSKAAQKAAAAGRRLWDTNYCGGGPHQDAQLRMWVNWDADGSDRGNMNGEWVTLKNDGSTDVPIGRWWIRDSWLDRYTFPRGTVVPAGRTVTLFLGNRPSRDTNRSTHFYWGRDHQIFDNAGRHGMGDGGYLFDPDGDLRFSMQYPCRVSCSDPLRGKVEVRAHPKAPEEVVVRNTSANTVDLEGYVIENDPWIYVFGPKVLVPAGQSLLVVVTRSPRLDTNSLLGWGKSKYILNDGGDVVSIRTETDIRLSCDSWGDRHC